MTIARTTGCLLLACAAAFLAAQRLLSATVLLVNSPHAEQAVQAWNAAGRPLELGWHPCLTMDPPVLPAKEVPSLVGRDGCLWPLGQFMRRAFLGRIRAEEVEAELSAQWQRFSLRHCHRRRPKSAVHH